MKKSQQNVQGTHTAFAEIITEDPQMIAIFQYIESIAGTTQPVLITGETGVGKELIAKAIHSLSGRKGRFVAVNVAGLEDQVFNDTLFGHVKGAFTGADTSRQGLIESAAGGTLFLDEIGDLSVTSQAKLLRLLQESEFFPLGSDKIRKTDARIEAATNQDLWVLQRNGKFRRDLNFRIRTHHIHVPPLHERSGDILLLFEHFLTRISQELGRDKPGYPAELVSILRGYAFPGNIRELGTMVFDVLCRIQSDFLSRDVFNHHIASQTKVVAVPRQDVETDIPPAVFSSELPTIKQATQLLINEALRRSGGNQTAAARMLGVSQPALSKRMKKRDPAGSDLGTRKE